LTVFPMENSHGISRSVAGHRGDALLNDALL
jgi:hypothetical protein